MRLVIVLALAGCDVGGVAPQLRVEPAAVNLVVVPDAPAPEVALQVTLDGADVAQHATYTLDGLPLGRFIVQRFLSDGKTGGQSTIHVQYGDQTVSVPVTVLVQSTRYADGLDTAVAQRFATASSVDIDAQLDPGDGVVLPSNLGGMTLEFAAGDADDLHEVHAVAPYLDVTVYTRGTPGPRHIDFTPAEWAAIASTAKAGYVDVTLRSMHEGAAAQTAKARYGISDLDLHSIVFSAGPIGGTASIYRYDPSSARTDLFIGGENGTCLGCHVAVSHDGTHLLSGSFAAGSDLHAAILDLRDKHVVARPAGWALGTFDPDGALVACANGALTLLDGTTGAPVAALPVATLAAAPAVSPDGNSLAYLAVNTTTDLIGTQLRYQGFDAATATLGSEVRTLAVGGGIKSPQWSSDSRWLVYARTVSTASTRETLGPAVVDIEGHGYAVTDDTRDNLAHWASPMGASTLQGVREQMAWIVMTSHRSIGARPTDLSQLWLVGFYPDRGVATRPFPLPGQLAGVTVMHAPSMIP